MKSWFARHRISAALDDLKRNAKPADGQRPDNHGAAAFEKRLKQLDARLQSDLPTVPAPGNLHAKIMGAVRRAESSKTEREPSWGMRLAWGMAATAAVVMIGFWLATTGQPDRTATASLHTPDATSPAMASAIPAVENRTATPSIPRDLKLNALAPLEKEMRMVEVDLAKAMQVAIASLPITPGNAIEP